MRTPRRAPIAAYILRASLLSLVAPAAAVEAFATVPGDQWEMTTKMSMPGMPMQMPAQTSKFCRPKGKVWDEPPTDRTAQDRCKMTDYRISGDKASWKVTCSDGMSGSGEMTYRPDSFAGTMSMTSEDISMKMEMSGRKVGDCDAAETVKMVERARKAGEEADRNPPPDPMVKICADAAAKFERYLFVGPAAMCKQEDHKAAFCKHLSEEAAYDRLARESSPQQDVVAEVAAFCGTSVVAARNSVCEEALEAESFEFLGRNCTAAGSVRDSLCPRSLGAEALDFLAQHCAREAKEYAARHCAGRKFTAIPEMKVRAFCTAYAEKVLAGN